MSRDNSAPRNEDGDKTRLCPQCKERKSLFEFHGLPLDVRCDKCVPEATVMELYDKKVKLAGQKLAQLMDNKYSGKGIKPLEQLVSGCYSAWGGPAAFCEDLVSWVKDLASNPRSKGSAVSAALKIMALHAKVDRMKMEDDWRQMDDDTLKATLKMRMMELVAETELENEKKTVIGKIAGLD